MIKRAFEAVVLLAVLIWMAMFAIVGVAHFVYEKDMGVKKVPLLWQQHQGDIR